MKTMGAALAAILIMTTAGGAFAGIVIEEQLVIDRGNGQPVTQTHKVMIQGNKQKSVGDSGQEMVTDLDAGTTTMVNPARKAYVQMPFPPNGMPGMGAGDTRLSFKKTGVSKKVAGYSCDEYTGAGSMGGNDYTLMGCFSKAAPGSSDFAAFQRTMAQKVKGTPMAAMANVPDGVPMELDTTTKVRHLQTANMPPDQAAKIKEMLAKQPTIVTHTTVTKVTSENLPADTFQPPAGYEQQQMGMGPRMGGPGMGKPPAGAGAPAAERGAPPAGGSTAPNKVPE
jgi:hypothetical protein